MNSQAEIKEISWFFLKKIFFAHWVCSWMPLRQARDGWREKGRNKKKNEVQSKSIKYVVI